MVSVVVPEPQLELSEQPKTSVTSAVFNRPLPTGVGAGLGELGAGAEDLAGDLAKQQAQSDLQNQKVTIDASGQVQMADASNSIIMGRAGEEYNQAINAGNVAALGSEVKARLQSIQIQYPMDPVGFQKAADAYVAGVRANTAMGPGVANALGDIAADEATSRLGNVSEKSFELGARSALGNVQTEIADTQNRMRAIAQQGGIQTPEYAQLQANLAHSYDNLKSAGRIFGYAPDRADSEMANSLSQDKAEAIVSNVDRIFHRTGGDGGRAGAQHYLQALDDPSLNLTMQERDHFKQYGLAHLDYLTSNQKAQIDASRVGSNAMLDLYRTDPSKITEPMFNQAKTAAQLVGDSESALKLQYAHDTAPTARALQGLPDDQRLAAMTGNDYVSKLIQQESGGNAGAVNATTGAAGIGQFIPSTWATLMRQHPELNLTAGGATDPAQASRALVAFTNANKAALQSAGIAPTDANTYMAHFLGAGGATNFIKAMNADPSAPAAGGMLAAATANPTIFYKPGANGKPDPTQPRSYSEVYALQTRRFGDGTTPVVAAGVGGAPTPEQMKANPFALPMYLQSLKTTAEDEVKTARNVGATLDQQFSQGNIPPVATTAAYLQMAARHSTELGEQAQKVQNYYQGATEGTYANTLPAPQRQAYAAQVAAALANPTDLNAMGRAQEIQRVMAKGAENLQRDPIGEGARRGWIRPVASLDLSGSDQAPPIPQQIGLRSQAATAIASHTGQQQPLFGTNDMKAFQQAMPLAPAPVVAATMGALSNAPPAQLDQLTGDKDFKATVMGLAHSGDPVKMNAAYSFLDAQYRRNPATFQAEDGGKTLAELRTWQTLGQFLPPDQVAKRMATASDPDDIKSRDALEKVAEKNLANLDPNTITSGLFGSHVPLIGTTIPFTSPGAIASPQGAAASGALLADYGAAYTDMYKETGDAGASDAFAKEKLGNKYSVSALNGGRVMAYAPDKTITDPSGAGEVGAYYPKVNGTFDWLHQQLASDVANSRFGHDFRLDNRNQTLPEIALLPDAKTQADIAAKRPPSYQVIARSPTDGRFHLIEGDVPGQAMRFRGDPARAQAEAATGFDARRANAAAVDATPVDLPMGGN